MLTCQTDEEPEDVDLLSIVAFREQDRQGRPGHFACWDPDRRADPCQDKVARNFAKHISYCPTCLHIVQLIFVEPEVLFHARNKGIVDVDLVKIPMINVSAKHP